MDIGAKVTMGTDMDVNGGSASVSQSSMDFARPADSSMKVLRLA